MLQFFRDAWDQLINRPEGTMGFRFLIQPVIAIFLAIRAGMRDARENRPPLFWSLAFYPENRKDLRRSTWHDVGKIFIIAIVLDLIYEVIKLKMFYPVQTLIVAFLLAILPYLLFRAGTARLLKTIRKIKKKDQPV